MKVKILRTPGRIHALHCCEGDTVDVSEDEANRLVKLRIGEIVPGKRPKKKPVIAVAKKPKIAEAEPLAAVAEPTKPEPQKD